MTAEKPYDWLRTLPKESFSLSLPPLFGSLSAPDISEIETSLAALFPAGEVSLSFSPLDYRSEAREEVGVHTIEFVALPYDGRFLLQVPEEELNHLFFHLMGIDEESHFVEPDLLAAFRPFFYSHVARAIKKGFSGQGLSIQWTSDPSSGSFEDPAIPKEVFPRGIFQGTMNYAGGSLPFEICLSDTLLQSLRTKAEAPTFAVAFGQKSCTVPLHFEIGKVTLSKNEFYSLKKGDYLVLDSCSFRPDQEEKSRLIVRVQGKPLFRAKIKENGIKLLEYPLFEEIPPMAKNIFEDEPESDETYSEDESTFVETTEEEEEITQEEADEEVEALIPSEEESPIDEELEQEAPKTLEKVSFEDLSMEISVEVARLQMPIKEIMELKIGSLLNLNINPANGVDLVFKDKTLARGELLKVGELLGVRITDLAHETAGE